MSDDNIDNAAMSNNNTDDTTLGDDNTENVTVGETSTDDIPSPLIDGKKKEIQVKSKSLKGVDPFRVKPLEPPIAEPPADEITTEMAKSHTFDPTDVRVYEFFIQGTPNLRTQRVLRRINY